VRPGRQLWNQREFWVHSMGCQHLSDIAKHLMRQMLDRSKILTNSLDYETLDTVLEPTGVLSASYGMSAFIRYAKHLVRQMVDGSLERTGLCAPPVACQPCSDMHTTELGTALTQTNKHGTQPLSLSHHTYTALHSLYQRST
jgi:hypothetical protein